LQFSPHSQHRFLRHCFTAPLYATLNEDPVEPDPNESGELGGWIQDGGLVFDEPRKVILWEDHEARSEGDVTISGWTLTAECSLQRADKAISSGVKVEGKASQRYNYLGSSSSPKEPEVYLYSSSSGSANPFCDESAHDLSERVGTAVASASSNVSGFNGSADNRNQTTMLWNRWQPYQVTQKGYFQGDTRHGVIKLTVNAETAARTIESVTPVPRGEEPAPKPVLRGYHKACEARAKIVTTVGNVVLSPPQQTHLATKQKGMFPFVWLPSVFALSFERDLYECFVPCLIFRGLNFFHKCFA
jgi:hypothetical protein